MNEKWLQTDDLIENPSPRVPICLCIDVSRSMSYHNGINYLKDGIKRFYQELKNDSAMAYSAEIAIVTFSSEVKVEENFEIVSDKSVPEFQTGGNTILGTGVLRALSLLDQRKEDYKRNGINYYQPWLLIMTDGSSYGESKTVLKEAQEAVKEREKSNKLVVIPIGVGENANFEELNSFSAIENRAIHVNKTSFSKFFAFISRSVSEMSQTDDNISKNLNLSQAVDWDDI